MPMIRLSCVLLLFISFSSYGMDVHVPKLSNDRDRLVVDLIKLVLRKQGIKANVIEAAEATSDSRQAEDLRSEKLSLIWSGMGQEREDVLLPVRIPIFKGIQGHRIFSIRPEAQSAFSQVKSLEDLKRFKAGSGMGWGDTNIIIAAGLPTVTTTKGVNLWPMLDGGRFDYFPLAIHEPWGEIKSRPEYSLTVEKNLMIVYPFAMYFYVSKDNKKLHDTIYKGMNAAIDDGSYDTFLFSSPIFKDALIAADVSQRTFIRVGNPYMHPATPVDIEKYWLDPKKLTLEELRSL